MAIRIGVIGAGRIGRYHASVLDALGEFELAAIGDINQEFANDVASRYRTENRSIDSIISDADIDAIAICSSTDTHVELSIAAAKAGKAIFCEKPISLDLNEVDRAIEAVQNAGTKYMVGFNRRFDPGHLAVRKAVQDGTIGELHSVHIVSRDSAAPPVSYVRTSGGMFLDMTIHDFDMAGYIAGSDVVEVFAKGASRVNPEIGAAGDIDTAKILLTHADGTYTTIDNSREAAYGYDQRLEAFGSKGAAISDNVTEHNATLWTKPGSSGPRIADFFIQRYTEAYRAEWLAFAKYVEQGGESPVSIEAGRKPVVIALAAMQSMKENRPVAVGSIK